MVVATPLVKEEGAAAVGGQRTPTRAAERARSSDSGDVRGGARGWRVAEGHARGHDRTPRWCARKHYLETPFCPPELQFLQDF